MKLPVIKYEIRNVSKVPINLHEKGLIKCLIFVFLIGELNQIFRANNIKIA